MSEEQKVPTKEEIIAFLKEQIEVKSLQVELQELNTKLAGYRAEELKALGYIAQMTQPKKEDPYEGGIHHKLTQEDLDNNPEFEANGLKVGDEVVFPKDSDMSEEEEKQAEEQYKKERNLKKK